MQQARRLFVTRLSPVVWTLSREALRAAGEPAALADEPRGRVKHDDRFLDTAKPCDAFDIACGVGPGEDELESRVEPGDGEHERGLLSIDAGPSFERVDHDADASAETCPRAVAQVNDS